MCTPLYNPYAHRHCCMYARQNGGSLSLGFLFANFQVSLFLFCTSLSYVHITTLLKRAPFPKWEENTATQEK